jgi:hypothetical protein
MTALRLGSNLVLTAIFVSGAAFAQQPIGQTVAKLTELKGTVLVNGGGPSIPGANDLRLAVNARISTGPGAKVTINYDKGCDVRLDENQRFTVREGGECCALVDSVEASDGTILSNLVPVKPLNGEFTVAKLTNVEGTILVSEGDAMAAGFKDQRLKIDTRVVTTAASTVIIDYDRGCNVRLYENQRFQVRDRGGCCALIAAVEGIGAPVAVAASGITGLGILSAVGVGSAVIIGVGRLGGNNVSDN